MYCLRVSWCLLSMCVCMDAFYIPAGYLAFSFLGGLSFDCDKSETREKNTISVLDFSATDLSSS